MSTPQPPAGPRDAVVQFAAAHDWPQIWAAVMQTRGALLSEALDVTPEQALKQPAGGEGEEAWSIVQVLQHVLTYTRNVAAIIEGTAHGRTVIKDPPGAIGDVAPASLPALLAAIVESSADLATLHRRLPAEPDLETTVAHPAFGPFNCREWFYFLTVHDAAHQRQIAALKQPAA